MNDIIPNTNSMRKHCQATHHVSLKDMHRFKGAWYQNKGRLAFMVMPISTNENGWCHAARLIYTLAYCTAPTPMSDPKLWLYM